MVDGEAVLVKERRVIIIEPVVIEKHVAQGIPDPSELSVVVPSAALAMDVDHQIEQELRYLK